MPSQPTPSANAAFYIRQHGSARAALNAIERPGIDNAAERAENQELRTLASHEAVAENAKDGRTWGERFLEQQARQEVADAERQAAHLAYVEAQRLATVQKAAMFMQVAA